ncbi:MAG: guanylate kinase [Mycobacteriales bacterium]
MSDPGPPVGEPSCRLTVLAGPTAVGKGTVTEVIRREHPEIWVSVSVTTRPPRPGEEDGIAYHFVSDEEFDAMLAHGELLEWATLHGTHRSGTPRQPVEQACAEGRLALLEIDIQGARQVRAALPEAFLVFLAPPSWEELARRLTVRGTETVPQQQRRLRTAKEELDAEGEFDAVIVNAEVGTAARELVALMVGPPRRRLDRDGPR